MLNFDIQSHKPLREIVYEELRSLILTGQIKPGTRMMEIELADDMGVSRTPIREAIRKLEKEGLVTIEPRKGAYASEVSIKDMVDILEVRGTLEGLAAYLAATRMTKEEKELLIEYSNKFDASVESNDI
ncbi:MAG: GntR family transcriptional regulator, partial [Anaerovorax sp.]